MGFLSEIYDTLHYTNEVTTAKFTTDVVKS